ncbi:MAG: hypothetical protein FI723_01585 [SAR202 cluster bacterium]|nr:hypothetical protein [SAR202 cluster bacterium]
MPESVFSFILAHQSDAADSELLRWIKVQLDHIFGSEPWAVVAIMGFIILAIPIFVGALYLMQANRRAAADPIDSEPIQQDGQEQERAP